MVESEHPPENVLHWQFLADISKVYGRINGGKIVTLAWTKHLSSLEISMASLKTFLTANLDAGLKGDLKTSELHLRRLNHLLHASPEASAFFVAGSDFVDSLISCYKLMNPPLRKAIISTTYLCLIGLTEGEKPNFSSLVDQLYSLKAAAETHKAGPTNENDSLVAELVTVTPILKQVQSRIEASESISNRAKTVLFALGAFKKARQSGRPPRLVKRRINKGKSIATSQDFGNEIHVHRMSLISQIQDLFPDLGSGFIVKLLDEYSDNVEIVISHLLEDSLPPHLSSLDRSEALLPSQHDNDNDHVDLIPSSTPPLDDVQLPIRRNVFDDDAFDNLAISTSNLHFGRKNPSRTADDVLQDRTNAPNKSAILAALAAFDSDDDERDDTYDVEDVGGTVDSANPEDDPNRVAKVMVDNVNEETLFETFKSNPGVFGREAATRRGKERANLKQETGMTDEAIEGWGLMLSRDQRQLRRLETKFSTFRGNQNQIQSTAWTPDSGTEGEETDGRGRGGVDRGRGGRILRAGGGGGGGRGRGRGNVAGPTGDRETEAARHKKEANKGSRANHNRRDQRAKKMARGGFPG